MVVLAMVCDLSGGAMFFGGVIPGLIAWLGLMVTHWIYASRDPALACPCADHVAARGTYHRRGAR
ncbi:Tripartite ATP-independent transporter, DctM component [Belnapia rosea]|nr:Tripartite ATP-independent transporter, DctM component [Belnapia rosea]